MSYLDQPTFEDLNRLLYERRRRAVAWIGAGLSQQGGVPGWTQLSGVLVDRLRRVAETAQDPTEQARLRSQLREVSRTSGLWDKFEVLRHALGNTEFRSGIQGELDQAHRAVPEVYKLLWRMPLDGVLNLNIDTFASRGFAGEFGENLELVEFVGKDIDRSMHLLQQSHTEKRWLSALHGRLSDYSSWVFTNTQLESLMASEAYQLFIKSVLTSRVVIFVGITADDVAVGSHLERLAGAGMQLGSHYWITHRGDPNTKAWADSVGVSMIEYNPINEHAELRSMLEALGRQAPSEPEAPPVVPAASIAPERSISADEWPDAETLASEQPEHIRRTLNAIAKEMLERDPTDAEGRYAEFLRTFDRAIHTAWYVPPHGSGEPFLGYKLDEHIEKGSFGRVFSTTSASGERLAIKLFHEQNRDEEGWLVSFRRGVRTMRILSRANVKGMVRYVDAWEIPSAVAMEFIDGPTLKQAYENRWLTDWVDILGVGIDLTRVIRAAHQIPQSVLHRDIRPTNVMLRNGWSGLDDAELVVLDFDLSWHRDAEGHTLRDRRLETGYIAPEQVERGAPGSARSPLVDSFGLGMTLLYLASGIDPHYGDHRRANWSDRVHQGVDQKSRHSDWKSLPARYARLVLDCTRDLQSERLDTTQIFDELQQLNSVIRSPGSIRSATMLADEIAARSTEVIEYEWNEEQAKASASLRDGFDVCVQGDEREHAIRFQLTWQSTGDRNRTTLAKYLPTKAEAAAKQLKQGLWQVLDSAGGGQRGRVYAQVTVETLIQHGLDRLVKAMDGAIRLYQDL